MPSLAPSAGSPRLRREQVAGMNIHYIMWSLDYFLDVQQRLGFKSIELWAAEPHVTLDHTGYFEADELRRKVESRGLSVSSSSIPGSTPQESPSMPSGASPISSTVSSWLRCWVLRICPSTLVGAIGMRIARRLGSVPPSTCPSLPIMRANTV